MKRNKIGGGGSVKINNICFYYKNNQYFEIKKWDGENRYRLLLLRKKSEVVDVTKEPTTVILSDNQGSHVLHADEFSYVMEWIDFELDNEEKKRLRNSGFPVNAEIVIQNTGALVDVLQMMYREFYSDILQQEKILPTYFELFFVKLYDLVMERGSAQKQSQYEKLLAIRAEIYGNPNQRLSVKDLSAKAYLSVSYFQHLYKEYFHTTVVADMISSRIEYGKHLLVSTNRSIKEIAKELNYGGDVSFARQFRKVTGISPGKYKEQFGKQ